MMDLYRRRSVLERMTDGPALAVSAQSRPSRQAEDDPGYADIADELLGAVGPCGEKTEEPFHAVVHLDGGGRVVERG